MNISYLLGALAARAARQQLRTNHLRSVSLFMFVHCSRTHTGVRQADETPRPDPHDPRRA